MSRAAKLRDFRWALGHRSDELIPDAPSTHPLALRPPHIGGFPRRTTFWSDLEAIRSECDYICRIEETLGFSHMLQTEPGSRFWFAAHVFDLCDSLLGRRTSAEQPLAQADLMDCITLGTLLTQWEWCANYEVEIVTGVKVRQGGREGNRKAHGTSEEKSARWGAMAKDFRDLTAQGKSKKAARSHVAEKYGVSGKTVQRRVRA